MAGIEAAELLREPSLGKMTDEQGPRAAEWDEWRVAERGMAAMVTDVAVVGEIEAGESSPTPEG